MDGSAKRRPRAVVEEAVRHHLGERAQRLEVGVVTADFPGQRDVNGVVEVVAPLCVHAVAADLGGRDHLRVVQVGLGDQRDRPSEFLCEGVTAVGEFGEDVRVTGVGERVDGIETEAVDVVVAHPHQGVVDHVATDLVLVEVDRGTPCVRLAVTKVRAEHGQVVAARTEMVVHDVLDHGETERMAGVDEALVRGRAAVALVDGVPEHAVVPPVPRPVEGVDRQHLHEVDAQFDEMGESPDRRVERALGR